MCLEGAIERALQADWPKFTPGFFSLKEDLNSQSDIQNQARWTSGTAASYIIDDYNH